MLNETLNKFSIQFSNENQKCSMVEMKNCGLANLQTLIRSAVFFVFTIVGRRISFPSILFLQRHLGLFVFHLLSNFTSFNLKKKKKLTNEKLISIQVEPTTTTC